MVVDEREKQPLWAKMIAYQNIVMLIAHHLGREGSTNSIAFFGGAFVASVSDCQCMYKCGMYVCYLNVHVEMPCVVVITAVRLSM